MNKLLITVLFLMLFSTIATAQNKNNFSTEEIKNEFIKSVTASWSDFKVCEYHTSSENKKKFIEQSIDPNLFVGSQKFSFKEIFVTNQVAGETLHLGIIVIQYFEHDYEKHFNKQTKINGYMKNTKILTKYVFRKSDQALAVYYSETFVDEKVDKYFNNIN